MNAIRLNTHPSYVWPVRMWHDTHTYKCRVSFMCVTHMCNAYPYASHSSTSHIYMCDAYKWNAYEYPSLTCVTRMNETRHTYVWYVWMKCVWICVTHTRHSYERDASLTCVIRMDEMRMNTRHSYVWHVWTRRVTGLCVIHIHETRHMYVWHVWMKCVWIRVTHTCDTYTWDASLACVTRLFYMCHMTDLYVWIRITHTCDTFKWEASLMCVTCLSYMCHMTHLYV